MLKSARYKAIPHAKAGNHKIPKEVILHLTGKNDDLALDQKECLVEILVKQNHSSILLKLEPVIVSPTSGGEIFIGSSLLPAYPATFATGELLIVTITPI